MVDIWEVTWAMDTATGIPTTVCKGLSLNIVKDIVRSYRGQHGVGEKITLKPVTKWITDYALDRFFSVYKPDGYKLRYIDVIDKRDRIPNVGF